MASLALGVAGAVIGSFFGMPALGFALGSALGSMLSPGKGQSGPRLHDLRLQTSSYGKMIPFLYGAMRVGGNVIWTTDLKEHEHKSGGKGGPQVTTYTYTASFAVMLCEGPAQTVRRVWADGTLVYSVAPGDPILPTIPMTIYLGTDTQPPDPTMESILGVGEVPANHGYVYLVFADWDLGAFGNRLPSINAEVITTPIPDLNCYVVAQSYPEGPWLSGYNHIGAPLPFMYSWNIQGTGKVAQQVPGTTTQLFNGATCVGTGSQPNATDAPANFFPLRIDLDAGYPGFYTFTCFPGGVFNGQGIWYMPNDHYPTGGTGPTFPSLAIGTPYLIGQLLAAPFDPGRLLPAGLWVRGCCTTSDGTTLFVFTHSGATWGSPAQPYQWWKISGTTPTLVDHGNVNPADFTESWFYGQIGFGSDRNNAFCAEPNGKWFWWVGGNGAKEARVFKIDDSGLWQWDRISGLDNKCNVPLSPANAYDTGQATCIFSPQDGYCAGCFGDQVFLVSRYPPQIASPMALSDIVADISLRAGLGPGDIDVSQLVDLVDGYIIEQQSSARDCVTPLQSAYFFDGVESNAQMKFVKRGALPALTIPDDDLAAAPTNSSPQALVTVKRAQEVDLPATLAVSYVNGSAAYQIGTQYGRRLVTNSQAIVTANLAINMNDSKASSVAWTLLISAWMEREGFTIQLPRKYWYLEPTDVITTHGYTMRLIAKRDRADGVLEFDGVATTTSMWTQGPTSSGTGTGGGTNTPPILQATNLLLLDIPLIVDTDIQAGFYAAYAGAVDNTWRGATLFKSYDLGTTFSQVDSVTTANVIGTASTILGSFSGGNIFDELNVVTVVIGVGGGDLASDSEVNVLNGANMAVLGDEIIQFKNAVLTSPSTYNLSGLLRGRRGTEWAITRHVPNERFVLLPVDDVNAPLSDIGSALTYAAVTTGSALASTATQTFENDGAAGRCYSPVNFYGPVDPLTGDIVMTWMRRTRVGGQWQNLIDVPLSEASELYVVQIWNSDYTLCARVITGITSPGFTYTSAMQVTDFGAQQKNIYATVGQIGAFGLGVQAGGIFPGLGSTDDAPIAPVTPYNNPPPVVPPAGGCAGTVYNSTLPWALGDSGIIAQPTFFDKNSTWVAKLTTPASGAYKIRVWFFEYGGVPGMRHVTLSDAPCGAPLIPAAQQNLFYPQIISYMGTTNPFPTQCPTLLPATDYYFTITVDTQGSLPMAVELDIEAI